MSIKELDREKVLGQVRSKQITKVEAAKRLGITRQYDFKPGFAHEKLTEEHGSKLSDETVRQIMTKAGIWKGKKRKYARIHQVRPRRSAHGELIQLDGSPHNWFEERRDPCCSPG